MDGREIEDVEAQRGDIGQPRDAIVECAVPAGKRPWLRGTISYQAPAGARPVRHEGKQLRARQIGPRLALGHGGLQLIGQQRRRVTRLQEILALPQDHGGRGLSAGLRLGQHARAFDGVEGEIGTGLLLQFEAVPPGGEFIGPGLDGIDIAAGSIGHERTAPAIVAVKGHRRAAPFAVVLTTPHQRGGDDVVAVAIDIRPHLDALADDTLHREAAAIDLRKDVFDMESATRALDSLSCLVHGDAIDMGMRSRSGCGTGQVPDIYTKPFTGHWFPGNDGDGSTLPKAILFPHLENFATSWIVACKPRAEWTFSPEPENGASRPNISTVRDTAM